VEINELFSQNLVRIRKAKGYSQRELAQKTGLTQRMINFYEHNPQSIPVDKLKVLSSVLGVTISDFFNEDDNSVFDTFDVRWYKKVLEIQTLTESDRKEINKHINSLVEKSRLKKENESKV
jgi:transcriptional regulator with XRE-family HTH domain